LTCWQINPGDKAGNYFFQIPQKTAENKKMQGRVPPARAGSPSYFPVLSHDYPAGELIQKSLAGNRIPEKMFF
jgi:hypothetical protein